MSKELPFLVYCIENYKLAKRMDGKEVYSLFEKYGVLNYIYECYGALHTLGDNYIIEDIDCFIESRKAN